MLRIIITNAQKLFERAKVEDIEGLKAELRDHIKYTVYYAHNLDKVMRDPRTDIEVRYENSDDPLFSKVNVEVQISDDLWECYPALEDKEHRLLENIVQKIKETCGINPEKGFITAFLSPVSVYVENRERVSIAS